MPERENWALDENGVIAVFRDNDGKTERVRTVGECDFNSEDEARMFACVNAPAPITPEVLKAARRMFRRHHLWDGVDSPFETSHDRAPILGLLRTLGVRFDEKTGEATVEA